MRAHRTRIGAGQRGDAERGVCSNLRSAESIAETSVRSPRALGVAGVRVRGPVPAIRRDAAAVAARPQVRGNVPAPARARRDLVAAAAPRSRYRTQSVREDLRRCVTSAPTTSSGHVRRASPPPPGAPAHTCAHLVAAANSLADQPSPPVVGPSRASMVRRLGTINRPSLTRRRPRSPRPPPRGPGRDRARGRAADQGAEGVERVPRGVPRAVSRVPRLARSPPHAARTRLFCRKPSRGARR